MAKAQPKPTKGTTVAKEEKKPEQWRSGIEVGADRSQIGKDFFSPTIEKDPDFHYHWPTNDPRRIHEMKRKGYEIDPSASSEAAAQKAENQRAFLKRQIHDPDTPKENAEMAKELLTRMESAPIDTVTNIPSHVLMRQPMEQRKKVMQGRTDASNQMKDQIDANVNDLNKALQKSGKGGIKAFQEMFDSIK